MTSPPITITAEKSAVAAARLMSAHGVRRIPVVNHNGGSGGVNGVVHVVDGLSGEQDDVTACSAGGGS